MSQEVINTKDRPSEYMVLVPGHPTNNAAVDEIYLLDIWAILSRRRNLIFGVLAVSLAISVAITHLMSPVYQTSIHFLPPLKNDVAGLNIPNFSSGYTVDDVYEAFQRQFQARNNLWTFFTKTQLYKDYLGRKDIEDADINKVFENKFMKDMTLHQPKNETSFIYATLKWNDPTEGAALLNKYTQDVSSKTIENYIDELNDKLILDRETVQTQIELLRESAQRLKNNRLIELEENVNIAKELGIKRWEGLLEQKTTDVYVDVSGEQALYLMGYEVLEVEKRILEARKDNDPFTLGLNEKLDKTAFLDTVKLPVDRISVVRITQQAKPMPQPIEPRKMLIILAGTVLGFMLAIFAAFISEFVVNARARVESAA